MTFRRAFAVLGALVFAASLTTAAYAQGKPEPPPERRKLSVEEQRELFTVNELLDSVLAGKQAAPADLKLKFQNYYLKASSGVYIPYMIEMSGGTFSSFPVTMYVRAVQKDAAPAAAEAAQKPGAKPAPVVYPFADAYFLTEKNLVRNGDVIEISRALALLPGEYTLYIVLREWQPIDKKQAAPKTALLTQSLTVPDLTKGLTTSSVILAKALVPAPEQLTGQQQLEQPFTISGYRVTPAFSAPFPQSAELLFMFFVYNEGETAAGKPDLEVDYNFFRAAEEKPFTRLAPQSFNATTLPGEFSVKAGHQVLVGQGIPLKNPTIAFAPGDYRLEIKITDKTNSQTITRSVPFTVS